MCHDGEVPGPTRPERTRGSGVQARGRARKHPKALGPDPAGPGRAGEVGVHAGDTGTPRVCVGGGGVWGSGGPGWGSRAGKLKKGGRGEAGTGRAQGGG